MIMVVYFYQDAYRDFEHYDIGLILKYHRSGFPDLVSYNRFVELMKRALPLLTIFLKTRCSGQLTGLALIDSTPLMGLTDQGASCLCRHGQTRKNIDRLEVWFLVSFGD